LLMGTLFLVRHGAVGFAGARLIAFLIHGCWIYAYVVWMGKQMVKITREAEERIV